MATIEDKAKALQKSKAEEFASACPSRVIEMALEDLEAVEADKRYRINMQFWHEPQSDGVCAVCFAGSVIARRIGIAPYISACDDDVDFPPAMDKRFDALDEFRQGNLRAGCWAMGVNPHSLDNSVKVRSYEWGQTEFKANMWSIAELLKSHGL